MSEREIEHGASARAADPPAAEAARILIVDDDGVLLEMLRQTLRRAGFAVSVAADAESGFEQLRASPPEVLVTDLVLPGIDGIELLRRVKAHAPSVEVVLLSAHATLERAVSAMRFGAYDFLEKPIDRDRLLRTIEKAREKHLLLAENARLRERLAAGDAAERLVGTGHAIDEVRRLVARVAATDAPVLITGDSGTGKEVVADLLHAQSDRRSGPLVKISCAAIPENLLESELFGYERGAFSGAVQSKAGRFEQARGGTLFLDEIGEMAPAMQAKLLRVLQDGRVQRLGSTRDIHVDARVISATNLDLARALREGKFREDLYHRLNVFEIRMPALREHPEDIPVLFAHFLRRWGARRATPLDGATAAAYAALARYPWSGNVRELENVAQRAAATAVGPIVTEADLHFAAYLGGDGTSAPQSTGAPAGPGSAAAGVWIPAGLRLEEAEDLLIDDALRRCGGSKERAAHALGVSSRTLTRREQRERQGGSEPDAGSS
jgi:two-component system response regulator HydG